MKKTLLFFVIFYMFFCGKMSSVSLANSHLKNNIISEIKNGHVIDSSKTKKITFFLFENDSKFYYNNAPLKVENNKFEISIKGLTGKQNFVITDSYNNEVVYTYYISDKNGLLEDYSLNGSNSKTYIKNIHNVSIIYTHKEKSLIKKIETILSKVPQNMLVNLKEISLVPVEHNSGAAGITRYNTISLYNLSKYSNKEIENIVLHEIAHTWAYSLISQNLINHSYSNYKDIVALDSSSPSKYAKQNAAIGNYSEDFAESVAFYLINTNAFTNKCPARSNYISQLICK